MPLWFHNTGTKLGRPRRIIHFTFIRLHRCGMLICQTCVLVRPCTCTCCPACCINLITIPTLHMHNDHPLAASTGLTRTHCAHNVVITVFSCRGERELVRPRAWGHALYPRKVVASSPLCTHACTATTGITSSSVAGVQLLSATRGNQCVAHHAACTHMHLCSPIGMAY